MKTKNEINLSFKIKDISTEALKTLLKPTKETEEMIKKFNDSLERDCKTLADAYFSELDKGIKGLPVPYFPYDEFKTSITDEEFFKAISARRNSRRSSFVLSPLKDSILSISKISFNNFPKPKFKIGDKVRLNGKYEYEVYKVSKKGNCDYRYNLQSDKNKLTKVRECKLTKIEDPTTEYKFKVGDWVKWIGFEDARKKNRFYENIEDNVFQVVDIDKDTKYISISKEVMRNIKLGLPASSLEPYYPKCGEFFYCETKTGGKYIGCKSDDNPNEVNSILYNSYAISDRLLHKDMPVCEKDSLSLLRPATEDEIQQLKDKVKKEHNQEWNGTDWVDIKKSDKELFEEWGKYHKVNISTLNESKLCDKMRAYSELLLFAEWVNQFYEIESKYYIVFNTFDNGFKIEGYCTYNHSGAINFHSHEAAQRAIDCLGEELIKTALR